MKNIAFAIVGHNVGLAEIILILLGVFVVFLIVRNIGLRHKPKR